mgnify:FL=1
MRALLIGALALLVAGCATQTVRLSQIGTEAIDYLRALPAEARPRVVVAPVRDHTRGEGRQFSLLETGLATTNTNATGAQFLGGVHDMLITAMLNTGAFTVLERDDLAELTAERLLRAEAGEQVTLDNTLEGADLVVAAAITGFEPSGGGALPIPIPLSDRGDFGIIWLRRGTSSLAMDLRVLDMRTGRVVHSTAVTGEARRFGVDFDAYLRFNSSYASLPGVLGYYNNTPMHAAIMEMITLAVARVGEAAQPQIPLRPVSLDALQSAVAE